MPYMPSEFRVETSSKEVFIDFTVRIDSFMSVKNYDEHIAQFWSVTFEDVKKLFAARAQEIKEEGTPFEGLDGLIEELREGVEKQLGLRRQYLVDKHNNLNLAKARNAERDLHRVEKNIEELCEAKDRLIKQIQMLKKEIK